MALQPPRDFFETVNMTWQTVTTEPNLLGESPFWHPAEQPL
jgi:hypothetical protein